MEFAIKLIATSWLDEDALGKDFFEHFDGALAQRDGEWVITIYQESSSARNAAIASIQQLEKMGFSVRRVDRDLVDIPEIAIRLGRQRQNIHQFVTGIRRGSFPAPYTYLGDKRVWMWIDVATWALEALSHQEEQALTHDDACFVDAYLSERRDFAAGRTIATIHSSERSADKWTMANEKSPEESYRRKGVAIAMEKPLGV